MTTLADLTPEERAQCKGMWCGYNRYTEGGEPSDFVIMVEDVNEAGRIPCINPGAPSPTVWAPAPWMLTPRPDLPRAWQADGTPPAGEWQTGKVKIIPNENAKYDPVLNVITGDAVVDPDHEPRSSHDIRRWIGDWETIEEEQA